MDGMLNLWIGGIGCWVGDNGVMVLSYEDPDCRAAAAEILQRHEEGGTGADMFGEQYWSEVQK